MGHASRPRQHNLVRMDAQPRRVRLSAGRRRADTYPDPDLDAYCHADPNGNAHSVGYTHSHAQSYAYAKVPRNPASPPYALKACLFVEKLVRTLEREFVRWRASPVTDARAAFRPAEAGAGLKAF